MPATMALAGCLSEPDDGAPSAGDDDSPDPDPPFEVRTIDAPGSDAGTITVPASGTVTVCNFTRTECPTSEGYLDVIGRVEDRIEDERIRVLSLLEFGRDPTTEEEAFAEWWIEHDGDWTLAIDDERLVFTYFEVDTTPQAVVLGGDGTVLLESSGGHSTGDIVRAARGGLEALEDENG